MATTAVDDDLDAMLDDALASTSTSGTTTSTGGSEQSAAQKRRSRILSAQSNRMKMVMGEVRVESYQ